MTIEPHIMKDDAEPEKSEQHQRREKQIGYHGKAPSLGGETGLSYLVCSLLELSARWRYTTSGRDADAWLREAIRLARGTAGLAELARAEGQARPRAYLDWFAALEEEGQPREVLAAAQAALHMLPAHLPIR